mmetsp:Transcript_16732/g.25127  ORF Transcript_16732/g.25127 Transcript_16732/m.25127 type:complete len:413 (+) Transcript_16732:26-1264(+)
MRLALWIILGCLVLTRAFPQYPVYLPFRRTGSGSVTQFLASQYHSRLMWWNSEPLECSRGPFDYRSTWNLYMNNVISHCLTCRDCSPALVLLVRNPVDRFISQIFFHYSDVYRYFKNSDSAIALGVMRKLLFSSKTVTPDDMITLFYSMRNVSNLNLYLYPYEQRLSRSINEIYYPSKKGLKAALSAIDSEFAVVGTTERMSSFLVLLSRTFRTKLSRYYVRDRKDHGHNGGTNFSTSKGTFVGGNDSSTENSDSSAQRTHNIQLFDGDDDFYNEDWRQLNLRQACRYHLIHGMGNGYPLLRRTHLPSKTKLFTEDVIAALQKELLQEWQIWRYTNRKHKEQLRYQQLSNEDASDIWNRTCSGVKRITFLSDLKQKVNRGPKPPAKRTGKDVRKGRRGGNKGGFVHTRKPKL